MGEKQLVSSVEFIEVGVNNTQNLLSSLVTLQELYLVYFMTYFVKTKTFSLQVHPWCLEAYFLLRVSPSSWPRRVSVPFISAAISTFSYWVKEIIPRMQRWITRGNYDKNGRNGSIPRDEGCYYRAIGRSGSCAVRTSGPIPGTISFSFCECLLFLEVRMA